MSIEWHDVVGNVGVAALIITYFLLQIGRLGPRDLSYSAYNALGAGLILVSLAVDFNLAAAVIEGFWLVISVYGIGAWFLRWRVPTIE